MMNRPASARLQLLRYALAEPLVVAVALGFSGAQAQTVKPATIRLDGPVAKGPQPIYYVDGQVLDSAKISAIDPKNISYINILKSEEAQKFVGKKASRGVVLITTKANENSPAVLAFNKKHGIALQPASPTQTAALAAARAYVEKMYPNAKMDAVYEDKNKAGHYVARFAEGGQARELHFDAQGHPVAE